jgi:DNA-binding XRE family transcriptional regulator
MKLDLQFVDHPRGERLVILPETQYRILEKAAAEGFSAMRKASLGACHIPGPIRKKITAGENPVRALREWRGLTGRFLADLAGITPSMLSQIERTGKTGSTRTCKALADALGVPIDFLVPQGGMANDGEKQNP